MTADDQARLLGEAWDRTSHDRELATRLIVHAPDGQIRQFSLGAHAPNLSPEDIERIHQIWLDAVKAVGPAIHHRDIVAAALSSFEEEMATARDRAVDRLKRKTE